MRKSNFIVLCLLAFGVFSCSKDESSSLSKDIDPEGVNLIEDEQIEINAATAGITIDGAQKVTGSPVPTGNLAFSLDYSTQTAFQKSGFDIIFEAPAEFAGAYIQLKDGNGMASSYFDVPLSATNSYSGKLAQNKRKNFLAKDNSTTRKDENTEINVGFSAAIPAGTFCYVICIYDNQGNISQPQEVCVTVESWGGNVNLVADWEFVKEVYEGETTNVNESSCEAYSFDLYCDNGTTKEVEGTYCYTINGLDMTFNSNGTYSYTENSSYSDYDYAASQASCEVVSSEYDEEYISKGNWAYNEEKGELTLVEFEYTYNEGGEVETYTDEDGELVFSGQIELTASSFILKIIDSYQGEVEEFNYYFDKK